MLFACADEGLEVKKREFISVLSGATAAGAIRSVRDRPRER
jgi:hypothetical protein